MAAKAYRVYYNAQERGIIEAVPSSLLIQDTARVFDQQAIDQIHAYHVHLLKAHDMDYRLYTTNEAADINVLATQKFREMKVGSLSSTGKGFLLVLDPVHDEARLEVSANLEGVYTDAFISYVQRNWMVQYFKGNHVNAGILAMTELIIGRAQEAERGQEFDPANLGAHTTTGAGVRTPAHIGQGYEADFDSAQVAMPAQDTSEPLKAYEVLLKTYLAGNTYIDPDLFTSGSQALFAKSRPSAASLKNMGRQWSQCRIHNTKIRGDYAVITFALDNRKCGPMFLIKEDSKWKFDVVSVAHMIIYDFENRWQMRNDPSSPYMFAFENWDFQSGKGSGGTPMLWPLKEGP